MRQQWQQERKFSNSWQGEKGSSCWIFLNGRLCRGQLITKNRLELPVVSDRLELKLPSSFNLNFLKGYNICTKHYSILDQATFPLMTYDCI